jgi:fructose/tagatose bisphosphate aldolase
MSILLKEISKNTDVLYLFEKDTPVYFLLLDLFPNHKTVYIHDVCVNKAHRGKSLFKQSIPFLKEYYKKQGFTSLTLDASDSTKEEGLDQKARIAIFHKAGFDVNTETGYFTASGDYKVIQTTVVLDTGEIVEIQKKEGENYHVKNKEGTDSVIKIHQIKQCLDSELNPVACPMILQISFHGGKRTRVSRKSRKSRKNRKGSRRRI